MTFWLCCATKEDVTICFFIVLLILRVVFEARIELVVALKDKLVAGLLEPEDERINVIYLIIALTFDDPTVVSKGVIGQLPIRC